MLCRSLGLTSSVEKLDPALYNDATRRGSVLSGKLVTKKESMKEPRSACLRRRKSSLAPGKIQRRCSVKDEDNGSKNNSPGNLTPRCGKYHYFQFKQFSIKIYFAFYLRSGNMSRRGSMEPASEAMEALRQFQLKNSKSYKSMVKPASENLGVALKMIKQRRSLFEHGELVSRLLTTLKLKYQCTFII